MTLQRKCNRPLTFQNFLFVAGDWAGYYQLSESLGWDYETNSLTHVNAYPFDPQKVFLMCCLCNWLPHSSCQRLSVWSPEGLVFLMCCLWTRLPHSSCQRLSVQPPKGVPNALLVKRTPLLFFSALTRSAPKRCKAYACSIFRCIACAAYLLCISVYSTACSVFRCIACACLMTQWWVCTGTNRWSTGSMKRLMSISVYIGVQHMPAIRLNDGCVPEPTADQLDQWKP